VSCLCSIRPCSQAAMATEVCDSSEAVAACELAKSEGNQAIGDGDTDLAAQHYEKALNLWEDIIQASPQPKAFEVGQLVRYNKRNYFGVVMSCFPIFDEYFLKDLGSDKAIWVGDPGGDLRRFDRKELHAVRKEDLDLRQALAQNLALCHLRQKAWSKCVIWCDAALVIEGRATKALLRKGSALLQLNQPGPASDVLATVAEVTPKCPEVRRLLREAEARRSPTWVCVTGCCGPWGIVCGAPAQTTGANAIYVAPAEKSKKAESDAGGDAESTSTAPTASDIGPNFQLGSLSDCSSDCSSDEEPDPPRPQQRAPTASSECTAAPATSGVVETTPAPRHVVEGQVSRYWLFLAAAPLVLLIAIWVPFILRHDDVAPA